MAASASAREFLSLVTIRLATPTATPAFSRRQYFHAVSVPPEPIYRREFRFALQRHDGARRQQRFDFQRSADIRAISGRSRKRSDCAQREVRLQRIESRHARSHQLRDWPGKIFLQFAFEQNHRFRQEKRNSFERGRWWRNGWRNFWPSRRWWRSRWPRRRRRKRRRAVRRRQLWSKIQPDVCGCRQKYFQQCESGESRRRDQFSDFWTKQFARGRTVWIKFLQSPRGFASYLQLLRNLRSGKSGLGLPGRSLYKGSQEGPYGVAKRFRTIRNSRRGSRGAPDQH